MDIDKGIKIVRAKLSEIWRRVTPLVDDKDLKKEIYLNGDNNLYPYEVEGVINNSPTAYRAAKLMAKYIAGKGFKEGVQDNIVDPVENHKLSNIAYIAAESIAYHYGVFFHIGYGYDQDQSGNLVLKQKTIKVMDYVEGRRQKKDSDDFEKMFIFKDFLALSDRKTKKDDVKEYLYYPYNPDPKIVLAQIAKDSENNPDAVEALKAYRGQVFYLNLTPRFKYALSPIDSVYNDADSEYRFGLYTNTQFRSGFLGKTIAITSGLDEEQSNQTSKDLSKFLGSENSGDIYQMDVSGVDDLDKVLKIIQLKPQFDDKLFEVNSKRISRNILGAFNNIPEQLVLGSDGAMFGTSGETYKEMKVFYSEQTEDERYRLTECLTYLGFPCEIQPIAEREIKTTENAAT